ncbi:MAG TPA: LysR family transcriptional regulator [Xanthobacteraceae bacterium]|jgi:DNA-binding transcriptional LysR family regulator
MDKLRAIQYFVRAAETRSFGAAARSLQISTPAITQLVAALERSLGFMLFHRSTRGLSLTVDGVRYYEISRKVAAELHDAEQRLGPRGTKPRGTLTIGIAQAAGCNCVMPCIERFLARFPDVQLIAKPVALIEDIDRQQVDLAVLIGWPPERDLVVRPLAQQRFVVCASPEYWLRAGEPRRPEDLRNHRCIIYRNFVGTLLDRWTFQKKGERCVVNVSGQLVSYDRHWLEEAASAGAGVVRIGDLTVGRYLTSRLLVPVLMDWEGLEAPTIFAAYRPQQRQSRLVRAFLDFLVEVFNELESNRAPALASAPAAPRSPKPEWYGRAHGRLSSYVPRKRRSSS